MDTGTSGSASPRRGSVTERRWIYWERSDALNCARENTSTLVISGPGGMFVDVRLLRTQSDIGLFTTDSSGESGFDHTSTALRLRGHDLGSIEWAFAGTTTRWTDSQGARRARWRHWVDSRTENALVDRVRDEGEVSSRPFVSTASAMASEQLSPPQLQACPTSSNTANNEVEPQGRTRGYTLEWERGETVNPRTGKSEAYQELWADLPPEQIRGWPKIGATVGAAPAPEDTRITKVPCVVYQTVEPGEARGVVMRLGRFVQGICRSGEDIRVLRGTVEVGERSKAESPSAVLAVLIDVSSGLLLPFPSVCVEPAALRTMDLTVVTEGAIAWQLVYADYVVV